jgi:hypothetical protein
LHVLYWTKVNVLQLFPLCHMHKILFGMTENLTPLYFAPLNSNQSWCFLFFLSFGVGPLFMVWKVFIFHLSHVTFILTWTFTQGKYKCHLKWKLGYIVNLSVGTDMWIRTFLSWKDYFYFLLLLRLKEFF